jgi:DNA-binding NarL/FixJ family response regulator
VAIVEDRTTIRESIALLIEAAAGFRCAGSYASMEDALARIGSETTDVVLVDLVLPGMSGVEGTGILRERCPGAAPLVFTVYEEDERVFDALCAGAFGCIPKKTAPHVLLGTIENVARGGAAPMPPDAARRALELMEGGRPDEMRLLELLAQGHNHDTAALELGSTPESVSRLARSIYERLHAAFRTKTVR